MCIYTHVQTYTHTQNEEMVNTNAKIVLISGKGR